MNQLLKLLLASSLLLSLNSAFAQQQEEEESPKKKFVVPPDVNGMKTIIAAADKVRALKVGIYSGPGAPEGGVENVTNVLKAYPQIKVVKLSGEDIGTLNLSAYDVLVFPGGSGSAQSKGIGEAGLKNVREFVNNGGGYVGICAGAYLACSNYSWSFGILNAGTVSSKWRRGQGIVDLEMTEGGPKVLGDAKGIFKVRYNNGPIIKPAGRTDIPAYTPLTLFRTEMALNDTPVGVQVNSPAQAIATFGKGRVFISSPHPENTPGLENLIPRGVIWAAGEKSKEALP